MNREEPTAARRTLGRALDIAGTGDALARFLGLRIADIAEWREGRTAIPARVLLALVDVVAANQLNRRALENLVRLPNPRWNGAERRRP
jgi:DNA-binding transcriptional regulator YdaS (Cro superfamily)